MRGSMAACLLALLVAGCSSPLEPSDEAQVPAVEGCPVAERDGVVLWTGNFVSSVAQPFELVVDVPECARDARFELSSAGIGSPNATTVSLGGCGSADAFDAFNVQVAVNTSARGVLCEVPASGAQAFTVAALAPMFGTVTLRADLPVA